LQAYRVIKSINGILDRLPLEQPFLDSELFIDPVECRGVPPHIMHKFNVYILYAEDVPFNACCMLQSIETIFTVIIIINKKYELQFQSYLKTKDSQYLDSVCYRRELYIHELCHLIARINVFPLQGQRKDEQIFLNTICKKFNKSLDSVQTAIEISFDDSGLPSVFENDHFFYDGDDTDFNTVFSDMMINKTDIEATAQRYVQSLQKGIRIAAKDFIKQTKFIDVKFFIRFENKGKLFNRKVRQFLQEQI
jgi:hypothetical protein